MKALQITNIVIAILSLIEIGYVCIMVGITSSYAVGSTIAFGLALALNVLWICNQPPRSRAYLLFVGYLVVCILSMLIGSIPTFGLRIVYRWELLAEIAAGAMFIYAGAAGILFLKLVVAWLFTNSLFDLHRRREI